MTISKKCFVIHTWDKNMDNILDVGPIFTEKQLAFNWIDKPTDPFGYTFTENKLIDF